MSVVSIPASDCRYMNAVAKNKTSEGNISSFFGTFQRHSQAESIGESHGGEGSLSSSSQLERLGTEPDLHARLEIKHTCSHFHTTHSTLVWAVEHLWDSPYLQLYFWSLLQTLSAMEEPG